MPIELQTVKKTPYEADFLGWLTSTAEQIRSQDYTAVDWENLVEEIEAMGRREKRKLESNLVILLQHLLKWHYQPNLRSGSWKGSIREHRRRIRKDLQDSPSLAPYLLEVIDEAYLDAKEAAADETGLPLDRFPTICEYTLDQILDREFLPE